MQNFLPINHRTSQFDPLRAPMKGRANLRLLVAKLRWLRPLILITIGLCTLIGPARAGVDILTRPSLTIITHGYASSAARDQWPNALATAISARQSGNLSAAQGGEVPIYRLSIRRDGFSNSVVEDASTEQLPASFSRNGAYIGDGRSKGSAIVIVDWSAADSGIDKPDYIPIGRTGAVPTDRIAEIVASYIGRSPDAIAIPIHLIGHSRGGSVMLAVATALARRGVWIEQLTTLDPHPLPHDFEGGVGTSTYDPFRLGSWELDPEVTPLKLPDNVVYADNYFQWWLIPEGHQILGAKNTALTLYSTFPHTDVHNWYHFTADVQARQYTIGDSVSTMDERWYPGGIRTTSGFNEGRSLQSVASWRARCQAGSFVNCGLHDAISRANVVSRFAVPVESGALGINILFDKLLNPVFSTDPFSAPPSIHAGEHLILDVTYQIVGRTADIVVNFDDDMNPFNDPPNAQTGTCHSIGTLSNNSTSSRQDSNGIHTEALDLTLPTNSVSIPITCFIRVTIRDSATAALRRLDYSRSPIRIVQQSPGTPVIELIAGGNGTASIYFAAPQTGSRPENYAGICTATGQTSQTGSNVASPLNVVGLANGVKYLCSVTASNAYGTGPASDRWAVTPTSPNSNVNISSPVDLRIALLSGGANLTWTKPGAGAAPAQYMVYRDDVLQAIVAAPATNFFHGGMASRPGSYVYAVASCAVENVCSTPPARVTLEVPASADTQLPTAPGGVIATVVSGTQIDLYWSSASDNVAVTKYQINRSDGAIANIGLATHYMDTGLTPGTLYTYTVRAGDAAGLWSSASQDVSATTLASPAPDRQSPSRPNGLIATAASSTQVTLEWSGSSDNVGVTSYQIYRNGQYLKTVSNTVNSTDSGLPSNAVYSYMVRSGDAAGNWSDLSLPAEVQVYTVVPVPLSTQTLSGGAGHSAAIKSNGTVWSWGANSAGQLGTGSGASWAFRPEEVVTITAASAVATGANHTLSLKADQSVWAWGQNNHGQLGNGTATDAGLPARVQGLSSIVQIAGGVDYSLALKADNTVWAWGRNSYGQLGNCASCVAGPDGVPYSPLPIQVFSPAVKVVAGVAHTLAIKTDRTVWAWGAGLGMTSTPTQVPRISEVSDIAAGGGFSVALSGGNVWTWGNNGYGQLGNGTQTQSATPQLVSGLPPITAIAAGMEFAIALANDGSVWTWGYNSNGLGVSNITTASTPIKITGLSGVTSIAAGMYSALARRSNGTVWTWGDNSNGQLGNGSNVSLLAANATSAPVQSGFDVGMLASIAIVGSEVLSENSSARYGATATYDNGSVLQVPAILSLSQTSAAALTDSNLLSARPVSADTTVTLIATYSEAGVTRTATLPVLIKDVASVPGTPTQVTAIMGIGRASISFAAPASDGGSAVIQYTVTANPGGQTGTGTTSPILVPGLLFGTGYTFTVAATNVRGTGPESAPTEVGFTPDVPSAPTAVVATAGNGQAAVSFAPPASGQNTVTGYLVLSNPDSGSDVDAGSPITTHRVVGLTNGTSYVFTAIAVNAVGPSPLSVASNSVTPKAPQSIRNLVFSPSVLVYGGTTTIGAVGGESGLPVTFISTTPTVCNIGNDGNAVSAISTGNCVISANQPGNSVFGAAETVSVTITVGTAGQSIGTLAFDVIPLTYGGTTSVHAIGGASGNAVTFTSATPGMCSVTSDGVTVTALAAGICSIIADQAGNSIYSASVPVRQGIVIDQASQTIGALSLAPSTIEVGGTATVSAAAGGSTSHVVFSSLTPAVCSVQGAIVTAVSAGDCTIAADQAGDANYLPAAQVTGKLIVTSRISAPVCSISPEVASVALGASQAYSANCTNSPSSYSWYVDGIIDIASQLSRFTTTSALASGAHIVAVEAINAAGRSSRVSVALNVTSPTSVPVCTISPASPTIRIGVDPSNFIATCSNAPIGYEWRVDGIADVVGRSDAYQFQTNRAAGTYRVSVIAQNSTGYSTESSTSATLVEVTTPVCEISPATAEIAYGTTKSFSVSCTNDPFMYTWTVDGYATGEATSFTTDSNLAAGDHAISVWVFKPGAPVVKPRATLRVLPQGIPNCTISPASSTAKRGYRQSFAATCTNKPDLYYWALDGVEAPGTTDRGYPGSEGFAVGSHTITVYAVNAIGRSQTLSASMTVEPENTMTVSLDVGWNLLGNGFNLPIDIATIFGDSSKVQSVWAWSRDAQNPSRDSIWAFYSPEDGSSSYAARKGYIPLNMIYAGQGFWVNAKAPFNVSMPIGGPLSNEVFRGFPTGWNLVALGEPTTPSRFNSGLSSTPPLPGDTPINATSIWSWDEVLVNWYFYAATLEAQGGSVLYDYTASKGYLDFVSKARTLVPGKGLWWNKPQ
jgi:alpha-tubulin suppressor-like RCC1 family protein